MATNNNMNPFKNNLNKPSITARYHKPKDRDYFAKDKEGERKYQIYKQAVEQERTKKQKKDEESEINITLPKNIQRLDQKLENKIFPPEETTINNIIDSVNAININQEISHDTKQIQILEQKKQQLFQLIIQLIDNLEAYRDTIKHQESMSIDYNTKMGRDEMFKIDHYRATLHNALINSIKAVNEFLNNHFIINTNNQQSNHARLDKQYGQICGDNIDSSNRDDITNWTISIIGLTKGPVNRIKEKLLSIKERSI